MSLIFWTSYTATTRGVRLKSVCCEKCGGYYYYEMIRAAQGKAAALYNIDTGGAADRSAKAAKFKLSKALKQEQDPIPCPNCGHLQSGMPTGDKPGMPPALVWVEQAGHPAGGQLVTARPATPSGDPTQSIVLQLPRVELPKSCCNCGGPASKPLKTLFQLGDTPENLGLYACDSCNGALRSKALIFASIGWLLAILLGVLVNTLISENTRSNERWMAVGAVTLVTGFIFNLILPNFVVPPFSFTMIDARRVIARLKFRNANYSTQVGAAVAASHNAGALFSDETAEQAAELEHISA